MAVPIALFRCEYGVIGAAQVDEVRQAIGPTGLWVEIPRAHHHVMLDEPMSLVAALRTLLAYWDGDLPLPAES
jgi:hypothetical protein